VKTNVSQMANSVQVNKHQKILAKCIWIWHK
jgi:hypothetical protein